MGWRKVSLSIQDVASGKGIQLQVAFEAVFIGLGAPKDAGMFGGLTLGTNDYFFSPGAVNIAGPIVEGYGGIECKAPKLSELAILVARGNLSSVPFSPEH
jgi:hypothetical protein